MGDVFSFYHFIFLQIKAIKFFGVLSHEQLVHLTYLNNTIDMKAHDKLRDITHQIVQPVVNSCQNIYWFIVVSEKHRKEVDIGFSITTDVYNTDLGILLAT